MENILFFYTKSKQTNVVAWIISLIRNWIN